MNLDELVKMPEPAGVLNTGTMALRAFTADQLRAYGQQVAAAVAKRCAEVCHERAFGNLCPVSGGPYEASVEAEACANAIRREFGEVSNG